MQSISQPLSDDPTGQMVESILVAFDAYTSKEISKCLFENNLNLLGHL
jgi:hypothetical protein